MSFPPRNLQPASTVSSRVVVVGSGGAGLTAALAAAVEGANVTLLEASSGIGGTTAYSGGMMWVPNNSIMAATGVADSYELAKEYLDAFDVDRGSQALLQAYLVEAPHTVDFIVRESPTALQCVPAICDYRSELPGWHHGGRAVEPLPIPRKVLPFNSPAIRRSPQFSGRLTFEEMFRFSFFVKPTSEGLQLAAEREAVDLRCVGYGLVTGLLAGVLDAGVDVRMESRAVRAVCRNGAVVGLEVEGPHRSEQIDCDAVVLACGGFEWDAQLRRMLASPIEGAMSPHTNRGDGLRMAMQAGALTGRTDEAWWCPVISVPGTMPEGHRVHRLSSSERSLPGSIVVNRSGRRFINEALNYNDFGREMAGLNPADYRAPRSKCSAWIVVDAGFRERYRLATVLPTDPDPDWLISAPTIKSLAERIGLPAVTMQNTVGEFNEMSRDGIDEHFGRGESPYDRVWGDPDHQPNASLGALERGPYHALKLNLGVFGTNGGPEIDPNGQVLSSYGKPVPGLYAAGNAAAAMVGAGYPGPGATIGPAATFGYIAGRSAARL